MALSEQELRQIAYRRIERGETIRTNAGYAGEWGDRGGGAMIREAQTFLAGLDKKLPDDWKGDYQADLIREEKERLEYERLKAKFEGTS